MIDSKIIPPSQIQRAIEKLERAGYEVFLVGGCVRDYYLGKTPIDWDIATSAVPKEIKEVFIGYNQLDSGIKHGTIIIVMEGKPIEITTFRIEEGYSDGRRPDRVHYTKDILQDLGRRDFTINSMAYSLSAEKLIDPFHGRDDIKNRLVRSVGNPKERFKEDALRILRGIRFAAYLDFNVDNETKAAMMDCKHLLMQVSWERIRKEFIYMLLGENVRDVLMEFSNILIFLIPEVGPMVGFDQRTPYHMYDVYEHTLKAIEAAPKDILLRMTMFFHDIGKPPTFSIDEQGIGHFYGHARVSTTIAIKVLKRMRFSKKDIKIISELVDYHHREINLNEKSIKRFLRRIGEMQFRRLLEIKRADTMAKNPIYIEDRLRDLKKIEEILDRILTEKSCVDLKNLDMDGNDLIEVGIPQGKAIGIILDTLLSMVIDNKIENRKDLLLRKALDLYNNQIKIEEYKN